MRKIIYFFIGLSLIAIAFASIVITGAIYKANDNSKILTYIFQTDNSPRDRVGELQSIDNISATELRDKLLKKYIHEYFYIMPYQEDVNSRISLKRLSAADVFEQWQNTEAKEIEKKSNEGMLRIVTVPNNSIAAQNLPDGYDYYKSYIQKICYAIHYETKTWLEPNNMAVEPIVEHNTIYVVAVYKPGMRTEFFIKNKKATIKEYLQSGYDPAGLFTFKVMSINQNGCQ